MKSSDGDLLSIVLKCIDMGVTVQNTKGEIIYANDVAAKMVGFRSVLELINAPVSDNLKNIILLDKKSNPFNIIQLPGSRALKSGKPTHAVLQFQRPRFLDIQWIHIKAIPILDSSNTIEYVVNTFQDITESKNEDERMNRFISTASHEMKTPLAGIKAFNQLLEKKFKAKRLDNTSSFFEKIDGKVNEITRLINDFLDSTKIRTGVFDYDPEPFDFDEFVDSTINDLQKIFINHTIIKKGTAKRIILGDKSRIRQVLTNLLNNARKYSPSAKEIIVRVSTIKGGVQVIIQDKGLGIAKNEIGKIFEPFYRGEKENRGNAGGLGLGLYISSYIVKLHRGNIGVESKVGKGTKFHFTLPLIPKRTKQNNHF